MSDPERILEFDVVKQRLIKRKGCDFSHIVSGTAGYLRARFYFIPSEWEGCKKAASFFLNGNESAVLLDETDTCLIPADILVGDKFSVSVTGKRSGYQITTNKVKVRQEV